MTVIVDGLKDKHADKIEMKTLLVDAETKKELEAAGLRAHGIVAKDADGEVVMTVEGHSYGEEKVQEVVKALLGET